MKKILLIGASVRVSRLVKEVLTKYPEYEFAGVLDSDRAKAEDFCTFNKVNLPIYSENELDKAVKEIAPALAIITTSDFTHADYIVQCLDRKISCLVEKPLCINAEQCQAIWDAQKRNPEFYAVPMHNSRYHNAARSTRKLVKDGAIGEVRSILYQEKLDHFHGSSYFRRWNRHKDFSGGLQIHKSSHHFDRINFLLNRRPLWVCASGCQTAYGPAKHDSKAKNCSNCPEADSCEFFLDYHKNKVYEQLYGGNKHLYTPDQCVYDKEADIEDFFNVFVMYEGGIPMNYTLAACCAYEGEDLMIEGTTGRLEMCRHAFRRPESRGGDALTLRKENRLNIYRFGQNEVETFNADDDIKNSDHGGCDELIYRDLFADGKSEMLASLEDGIYAVLIGAAANVSIANNGAKVDISSLFTR